MGLPLRLLADRNDGLYYIRSSTEDSKQLQLFKIRTTIG